MQNKGTYYVSAHTVMCLRTAETACYYLIWWLRLLALQIWPAVQNVGFAASAGVALELPSDCNRETGKFRCGCWRCTNQPWYRSCYRENNYNGPWRIPARNRLITFFFCGPVLFFCFIFFSLYYIRQRTGTNSKENKEFIFDPTNRSALN